MQPFPSARISEKATSASRHMGKSHRPLLPRLRQAHDLACGPTCLASILSFWGMPHALATVSSLTRIGEDGASLADLVETAEHLGFEASAWAAGLEILALLPVPVILHMRVSSNRFHYVVLCQCDDRRAVALDPSSGDRVMIGAKALRRAWTGSFLVVEPPRASIRSVQNWFRSFSEGYRVP